MQIRGNESKRAENNGSLQTYGEQNDPSPSVLQDAAHLRHELRAAGRHRAQAWTRVRHGMTFELGMKQQSDRNITSGQEHECPAPAEGVGEKSSDELSSCHTHDGPRKKSSEGRLTLGVWHRVSDPGHGQWNDAGRRGTGYDSEENQPIQRADRRTSHAAHSARQRGGRDHAIFAIPVADGSVEQLQQSVSDGKCRYDSCGAPRRCLECLSKFRQQRITYSERRRAGESGNGQQR